MLHRLKAADVHSFQAVEKVSQMSHDSVGVTASSSFLLMAAVPTDSLKLNTGQPNCTSTCEPGLNGLMTVLTTCPGPAAVVGASPSMAMTAAPTHENLALPVPQPFKPQQVAAGDVVMIVGGAVLLVIGISLVVVLQ